MFPIAAVSNHAPQKFNVVSHEASVGPGARDAILPFSVLFTGLIINQLYFWTMHQSIIQEAGHRDSDRFHDDFLVPMEQVFLQQNDELIAHDDEATGGGPAS